MKKLTVVAAILFFLSFHSAGMSDAEHDLSITVSVGVLNGVMTSIDRFTYCLSEGTHVLVHFEWQDGGNLEEPIWSTESKSINVKFKQIRLAKRSSLTLEVSAITKGEGTIKFALLDRRTAVRLIIKD
ncbi:MAG: hypothetical protein ABH810_00235 [bacterium]